MACTVTIAKMLPLEEGRRASFGFELYLLLRYQRAIPSIQCRYSNPILESYKMKI